MGGKSSSGANIRLAGKSTTKAKTATNNERHHRGKSESSVKKSGIQSNLVFYPKQNAGTSQQKKPEVDAQCSDDETIANIPEALVEQTTTDAQASYGAISAACAAVENYVSERATSQRFTPGNDVQAIVDRYLQRGYGLPVKKDQKGSVYSILTHCSFF